MNSTLSSLTTTQLRRAADLKEQLDALNKELASILSVPTLAFGKSSKKPKKMSAAARAKIAAAQKARWAKVRGATALPTKTAAKASSKRKTMSAAAKARLSAMAKARWAKVKAAGKKKL